MSQYESVIHIRTIPDSVVNPADVTAAEVLAGAARGVRDLPRAEAAAVYARAAAAINTRAAERGER